MPIDRELIRLIRSQLAKHADPDRAAGQQRYLKSAMPFRGLTLPTLRLVLRPVLSDEAHRLASAESWQATVRALWDEAAYREERYAVLALAGHRWYQAYQTSAAMPLYEHLIVSGAWWDLVDEVATRRVGHILREHPHPESGRLRNWATGDDLWLRRSAIIAQLSFGPATDLTLLTDVIDANLVGSRFGDQFFVRKAIGWAVRQYARTDPDWVSRFVDARGPRLSGLSRREACKHLAAPASPR